MCCVKRNRWYVIQFIILGGNQGSCDCGIRSSLPSIECFLHCWLFQMSLTIQQIILDAKRLAGRLKERETEADALLTETQTAYRQIHTMKQVNLVEPLRRFLCCPTWRYFYELTKCKAFVWLFWLCKLHWSVFH